MFWLENYLQYYQMNFWHYRNINITNFLNKFLKFTQNKTMGVCLCHETDPEADLASQMNLDSHYYHTLCPFTTTHFAL